jgi:hydrogenase maturation protein HypF
MASACSIRVRGVVQGVGFRPFVYRLANANTLTGWVLNAEEGVEIHLEGSEQGLDAFVRELKAKPPSAATVAQIEVVPTKVAGFQEFSIRESRKHQRPTVRVSPDLPVCDDCLRELFDSTDPRYRYPYINCTHCGPRYTVVTGLPYDRPNTTMRAWPLDEYCSREYHDPGNRRFHAQPVACPECGPRVDLQQDGRFVCSDDNAIARAVALLNEGKIVAVKGLGGYHLACDARNSVVVAVLRERKFRKEKPFAVMVKNVDAARELVSLSAEAEEMLGSVARPIVLAPSKTDLPGVAPDNDELGVMLPYTPLHYLLFERGAPDALVMTSANRSSEPIAYEDTEALERLSGIADAFLIGERPIARRVDDSVATAGPYGPVILRRSRGYAPGAVTTFPTQDAILALGSDLKNAVTLVVNGQAFVSQHIGDLDHYEAFVAFEQTVEDLLSMYEVSVTDLTLVRDAHPQFASTRYSEGLTVARTTVVQHHRAHVASVLAERGEWTKRVLGVSLDGTGYGDDGAIWGGEFFVGSLREGFARIAYLRPAMLAGGDAAARWPVQAAAGFLSQLDDQPDLEHGPFHFPKRYQYARQMLKQNVRSFSTTSMGRLFDAAAALLGFVREATFEGQAAMWLEQMAGRAVKADWYPFPLDGNELDFRALLAGVAADRQRGRNVEQIARAFQLGVAKGLHRAIVCFCDQFKVDTVVLSGGVFQNRLLLEDLKSLLVSDPLTIWTNHAVPPNDGGISLGQAALAVFAQSNTLNQQDKLHEPVTYA